MTFINKKVIVRSNGAGIIFGTLVAKNGLELELKDSRKIYYWEGAKTVEDISLFGIAPSSQVTRPVSQKVIGEFTEMLLLTEEAIINLEGQPIWSEKED